jgi:Heparan-alpha-glucosaminide N-acetyltransferase, catalytic
VALAGMASVHVLPVLAPDGTETVVGAIAAGRASALFAVLAGVGIALGTGGTRPPASGRAHAAAAAGLLVRGLLVALVGLALVELDPPVAVILAYYGLLFAVAAPLLRLRALVLAVGAVLWCVLGPVASHLLRAGRPAGPGDQPGFAALATPGQLLHELAVTGYYPVLPWVTYLLAGMAVGRTDLRSARVAAGLLGGGAALAVAASAGSALLLGPGGGAAALGGELTRRRYGTVPTDTWWWLAVEAPHTGTPFDLAHTTGTALAVLGAMLLLARAVPWAVWVLAAVGRLPLTLYTLHVAALALLPHGDGKTVLVVHLLAALAIGVTLRVAGLRGPLEALVGAASGGVRRAVARAGG